MAKLWLDHDEQLNLLATRGLLIEDSERSLQFLKRVNYYRFSGYFRYWQRDPEHGDNQFLSDTRFAEIQELYEAEERLIAACNEILRPTEVLLRARFAHSYAKHFPSAGAFARGEGFTQAPNGERVEEFALKDLDRSKESFVAHYRDAAPSGDQTPQTYERMPIWVAVEAFSFGTLSRLIEASGITQFWTSRAFPRRFHGAHIRSCVRSMTTLSTKFSSPSTTWPRNPNSMTTGCPEWLSRSWQSRHFWQKALPTPRSTATSTL